MPTAIDLFAGAGGATQGLRDAGFDVLGAVESDRDAAETWRLNHPGLMFEADVRKVSVGDLLRRLNLEPGELDLLKACPPCQGFSTLRGASAPDEERNDLVLDTLKLVEGLKPKAVLLENVPGLARNARFERLLAGMRGAGYSLADYIVEASELGVPQRRRRLVVVAVSGTRPLPDALLDLVPVASRRPAMTAGQALRALTKSMAADDHSHRWRKSTPVVQSRIEAIPVDGTRFDLPAHLQLECHRRLADDGRTRRDAGGSYGRVKEASPAPTMTTRCTTPSCGSFIHPTEHRGLSLREAAAFQTFPASYTWAGRYESVERQIGNAVPVWMAEALGRGVLRLLAAIEVGEKSQGVGRSTL